LPSNWLDAITKASASDKFVGYRLTEKDLLKLVYQIKKSGKYHEMFWVSYLNQDFGLIVKKAPASRQRATDDPPDDLVDPRNYQNYLSAPPQPKPTSHAAAAVAAKVSRAHAHHTPTRTHPQASLRAHSTHARLSARLYTHNSLRARTHTSYHTALQKGCGR